MTIFTIAVLVLTVAAVLYAVFAFVEAIIHDDLNVKLLKEQLRNLGVALISGAMLGIVGLVIAALGDSIGTDTAYGLICMTVLTGVVGVIALLEGVRK